MQVTTHSRQFQPDVQVNVVVNHKSANHEDPDQRAEPRAFGQARTALVKHRVHRRENHHRHKNIAAIPAGITLLIPSWDRYTAGYFENSVLSDGSSTNVSPPKTKYVAKPPRAASPMHVKFMSNPFRCCDGLWLLLTRCIPYQIALVSRKEKPGNVNSLRRAILTMLCRRFTAFARVPNLVISRSVPYSGISPRSASTGCVATQSIQSPIQECVSTQARAQQTSARPRTFACRRSQNQSSRRTTFRGFTRPAGPSASPRRLPVGQ